jgi:hypothetical protein
MVLVQKVLGQDSYIPKEEGKRAYREILVQNGIFSNSSGKTGKETMERLPGSISNEKNTYRKGKTANYSAGVLKGTILTCTCLKARHDVHPLHYSEIGHRVKTQGLHRHGWPHSRHVFGHG